MLPANNADNAPDADIELLVKNDDLRVAEADPVADIMMDSSTLSTMIAPFSSTHTLSLSSIAVRRSQMASL
jgi:hypothetical protein